MDEKTPLCSTLELLDDRTMSDTLVYSEYVLRLEACAGDYENNGVSRAKAILALIADRY